MYERASTEYWMKNGLRVSRIPAIIAAFFPKIFLNIKVVMTMKIILIKSERNRIEVGSLPKNKLPIFKTK
jgi:hypothetical protein